MKTAAIIDQGYMNTGYFDEYLKRIRKQTGCDDLIVITTGNFRRSGLFTPVLFRDRFEAEKSAGADLIFRHPVFSTCLRDPYYNFSLTSFINKLRVIDTLILPVAEDRPESSAFAEKFTSDLKFSYSSVICERMEVPGGVFSSDSESSEYDRKLLSCINDYFDQHAHKDEMIEIFGGTDTLIDYLLENRNIFRSEEYFSSLINRLACKDHSDEKIRHYLLHCVMNLRKIDHSIMALYEYSPYADIIYENGRSCEITDAIASRGYIQQVHSYRDTDNCTQELNLSKQTLFNIEKQFCSIFE